MMKIQEAGLFEFWMGHSIEDSRRCLKPKGGVVRRPRLTLTGLSGAFIVLGIGTVLSVFFIFRGEFCQTYSIIPKA